jgi:hypothetical protein
MTLNLGKRVKKLERSVPQTQDEERQKEAALLLDTVEKLYRNGHPECTYNAIENNYKTLVDLCIEEGGYECTLTELNAAGKLDDIILQTCRGEQHGN